MTDDPHTGAEGAVRSTRPHTERGERYGGSHDRGGARYCTQNEEKDMTGRTTDRVCLVLSE